MIKMLTACTKEADDVEAAIAELREQLLLDSELLENAAAFMTCTYDFIETGVARAVCEALPFDVVGCTTMAGATGRDADAVSLCLSVLTSADCRFAASISAPLQGEAAPLLFEGFERAQRRLQTPPALVLAFLPMLCEAGGDLILSALSEAAGGAPIFGTIGCGQDTSDYTDVYTLYNGAAAKDCLALLLIEGDIHPRFFVTALSPEKIQPQNAMITASQENVLQTVNNVTAAAYLESIGLIQGDGVEGVTAIPFVVNYNDGTQPIVRTIYRLTSQGYAICGGEMPVNATLSIGALDCDDVLLTAEQTVRAALDSAPESGLILFPCFSRNLALGADSFFEIDRVRACIAGSVPYHFAYSGGELCPVYNAKGEHVNRFHNFTLIVCAF